MINDNFLKEMGKALNGESYSVPSYMTWSSSPISESSSSTSLSGEAFPRAAVSNVRSDNNVVFTAIKSGALASSTGDSLRSIGLNSSSSGGIHLSEKLLSSILHTTAFDVLVSWTVRFERE